MIVCGRPAQRAEQRLERSVAARMAAAFNRDQAVGFVCGFFVCATLVLVSQPSDVASLLPSRGHRKLVEEVQLHQVAPHHQRRCVLALRDAAQTRTQPSLVDRGYSLGVAMPGLPLHRGPRGWEALAPTALGRDGP